MYNQSFNELNQLIGYSKEYYNRGWLYATAGNLSVKEDRSNEIIITASGMHKGKLSAGDFLIVNIKTGKPSVPSNNKPSAETSIHLAIYNSFPESGAVLHVHDPVAIAREYGVTEDTSYKKVSMPELEMVKAFKNVSAHSKLFFHVFYNFKKVEQIADCIVLHSKEIKVPFLIIENHGLTVWGKDVEDANKNLEAAHHILHIMNLRNKI